MYTILPKIGTAHIITRQMVLANLLQSCCMMNREAVIKLANIMCNKSTNRPKAPVKNTSMQS